MPGGQYTNLKEQAEAMGLGQRWPEIARTYADVNMAFGDIVKVTPSSKVVGDMAMFLVSHGMTMREFEKLGPDHNLTYPELGGRDVLRVARRAGGRLAEEDCRRSFCKGGKPKRGPSGRAACRQSIFGETAAAVGEEDRPQAVARRIDELPDVPGGVSQVRQARTRPTATWKCCRRRSSSTAWRMATKSPSNLEPGKTLIIKFLTVGEPHPDGTRTVFFELNGQPREVTVRDQSLEVKERDASRRPTRPIPAMSARRFPERCRRSPWS